MPRLFITIILLLGTAVVGIFYLGPQWNQFQSLKSAVSNLQGISGELDTLAQNRDALIENINSISKDDLGRLDQSLPQGPHTSEFLVALEGLAKKDNVSLERIDLASFVESKKSGGGQPVPVGATTPAASGDAPQNFPINFAVGGSYDAFKSFLNDLETNIRLIDVTEIAFGSGGKGNIFDFSLKAKTYYQ